MPVFRNTIRKSRRERMRRVDRTFERAGQAILIIYALFILSTWISHREEFRISEIRVLDARSVDSVAVQNIVESELARQLLWKINRNNSLLYPRRAMISEIKMLDTRVKTVNIAVDGRLLTVRISEYSPAFLWCSPDSGSATTTLTSGCYFADSTGHIFAQAPDYSGTPFLIYVTTVIGNDSDPLYSDSSILSDEEFDKVSHFLQKLSPLGITPRVVRQSGAHDFTISTDRTWEIRWSSTREPEEDVRNLSLVLQNLSKDQKSLDALKAIDLRFGNKVFYR